MYVPWYGGYRTFVFSRHERIYQLDLVYSRETTFSAFVMVLPWEPGKSRRVRIGKKGMMQLLHEFVARLALSVFVMQEIVVPFEETHLRAMF